VLIWVRIYRAAIFPAVLIWVRIYRAAIFPAVLIWVRNLVPLLEEVIWYCEGGSNRGVEQPAQ
jgi:hypothetical protein